MPYCNNKQTEMRIRNGLITICDTIVLFVIYSGVNGSEILVGSGYDL